MAPWMAPLLRYSKCYSSPLFCQPPSSSRCRHPKKQLGDLGHGSLHVIPLPAALPIVWGTHNWSSWTEASFPSINLSVSPAQTGLMSFRTRWIACLPQYSKVKKELAWLWDAICVLSTTNVASTPANPNWFEMETGTMKKSTPSPLCLGFCFPSTPAPPLGHFFPSYYPHPWVFTLPFKWFTYGTSTYIQTKCPRWALPKLSSPYDSSICPWYICKKIF